MARFYFDLHECGTVLADEDGLDAVDFVTARRLAITAARDVMCGELADGHLCLSCFIEIRDEEKLLGRVLFKEAVKVTGIS